MELELKSEDMIPVTKPFMPPLEEYQQFLEGIWEREYLTNNGPLVQQLEQHLEDYLEIRNLSYVSNGTIALQLAIKALELKGEIITTPFSFVATTSSIVWEGCKPVFVDIDPKTLNIDPEQIENAITSRTSAILATHVFGNPCDVEAIQEIADRHQLKVIYDGAHAFGTFYKGESIFKWGDISTCSFHATKLYHTVEGGAVITRDDDLAKKIDRMRNFGFAGPNTFHSLGINGKNSEIHAAIGLCNLNYIESILQNRKDQWDKYDLLLANLPVYKPLINQNALWNKSYYPIVFKSEKTLLEVKPELEKNNVYPRRYFYPSLNDLHYVGNQVMNLSKSIANRILCLPLYNSLKGEEQSKIAGIITKVLYEKDEKIANAWGKSFSNASY